MFKRIVFVGMLGLLASTSLVFAAPDPAYVAEAEKDAPGSSDSALSKRYEGSAILGQTVKAFDELTVPVGPAEGKSYSNDKKFSKTLTQEGRVTRTVYVSPLGRSSLEVMRNFTGELTSKGFAPVFECTKEACGEAFVTLKYRWDNKASHVFGNGYSNVRGHLIRAAFDQLSDVRYSVLKKSDASGDTYVALYAGVHVGGGFGSFSEVWRDRVGILVEIVEPKAMEAKMVTVNSEKITGDIAANGRAVFYGIQFDFDKTDLKPTSAPQLVEMAKSLNANAKLKVYIVGHTDNQGKLDYNLGLSQRRAESVVKALAAQHGIAAARMTAKGLASLAPLASNTDETGRAKNRRVEMVEQ